MEKKKKKTRLTSIGVDCVNTLAASQKPVNKVEVNDTNASVPKEGVSSWKTQEGSSQSEVINKKSETPKGENKNTFSSKESGSYWKFQDGGFQAETRNAGDETEKTFRNAVFFKLSASAIKDVASAIKDLAPALKDFVQAISMLKDAFTKK